MSEQKGYGLLKGKKGIIFGALDERSIAWRIALACKREGRRLPFVSAHWTHWLRKPVRKFFRAT